MYYINVSIHDVTPAFEEEIKHLVKACESLGISRGTLLVIPNFHNKCRVDKYGRFVNWLKQQSQNGWELAMHGFTHAEDIVKPKNIFEYFISNFYTNREGEFYLLSEEEAKNRITDGIELLKKSGLRVNGFVAPAWLLSDGAKKALYDFQFKYTTTLRGIHDLEKKKFYKVPVITFSSRSAVRAVVSCAFAKLMSLLVSKKPALRLALHPLDARNVDLMQVLKRICKRELSYRQSVTLDKMVNILRNL
ncbi:polysaccharide deacetylase family protein [Peptococcaceae bacterium]|nr:polysaccharide deacetylase family protein [Peptococcaceae bacterium]